MYMPNWERNQQRFQDMGTGGQEGEAGDIVGFGRGKGNGQGRGTLKTSRLGPPMIATYMRTIDANEDV